MSVVGIDLSLTSTGLARVGYLDGEDFLPGIEIGNVKSSPKTKGGKGDTLADRQERLFGVANQVIDFVYESGVVDLVVIEAPSFGSKHGNAHDRSGLWWLVVNALREDGFPVAQVAPQGRAKYGTGKGNSAKAVVLAFVREVYTDLVGKRIPNDDVADAVLLASMGARHLGYPVEPVEPHSDNLAAMDGVLWPVS